MEDESKIQQQIDAGQRVDNFLKDEAVQGAFNRLKQRYYSDFLSSKEPEKVQAKAIALDEIQAELNSVVGNGQTEAAKVAVREKNRGKRQ